MANSSVLIVLSNGFLAFTWVFILVGLGMDILLVDPIILICVFVLVLVKLSGVNLGHNILDGMGDLASSCVTELLNDFFVYFLA